MSAIVGIAQFNEECVSLATAEKLKYALAHRAHNGVKIFQQKNLILGYGNLQVNTEQLENHLPLAEHNWAITANAYLFNKDKLIKLLGWDNQQTVKTSDSILILAAFQKWGIQCLQYLEGEFAFAIANLQTNELFLAIDPLGHRPVFYTHSAQQFIFCSDIKTVVELKTATRRFNENLLVEYALREVYSIQTYDQDVSPLNGGHYLHINSNGKITHQCYWQLQNRGLYRHLKTSLDWAACLYELLYKAVVNRLPSESQHIGVTLSGGLDSTAITCLLSTVLKEKNQPLYTFSSVLPANHSGIERDERQYIEMVNHYCGNLIQTYIEPPGNNPFQYFEQAWQSDETFPNTFYNIDYTILLAARRNHINMMYSGYGGDFWVSWTGSLVVKYLVDSGKFREAFNVLKSYRRTENVSWKELIRREYIGRTKLHKLQRSWREPKEIDWSEENFLKQSFINQHKFGPKQRRINRTAYMLEYISTGRISKTLATFANRNEIHGMTPATPMFDKDVMEFLIEVPLSAFVTHGRHRSLLKTAMQGRMPDSIINRQDKLPYAPGYHQRLINSRNFLIQLLNEDKYQFVFERYLDKQKIEHHIDDVLPQVGFTKSKNIVGIRLVQAGNIVLFLEKLNQAGYFDK